MLYACMLVYRYVTIANMKAYNVKYQYFRAPAKTSQEKCKGTTYPFSKPYVVFLNPHNLGLDYTYNI